MYAHIPDIDIYSFHVYFRAMNAKSAVFLSGQTNTPDIIANHLRQDILNGKYKANQPLRQDRIAEELGVSKIPLREALVQLKAEGLVSFFPKRGAVVAELSASEVEEIYAMRVALELVAIERAIPQLGVSDLIRSQGILEIIDSGSEKENWSDLNWEFHAILYSAAQMPMLLNTIQSLHNNVARYLVIYLDHLAAAKISQKEHWQLLEACREQNIPAAKKVLKRHLIKASDHLTRFLANE